MRGPARVLDGAIPRGLGLKARVKGENIYEPLAGKELMRRAAFAGVKDVAGGFPFGFDEVLVEKDFRLSVDFVLPKEDVLRPDRPAARGRSQLVIRQLWKGDAVGAAGIFLQAPEARRGEAPKARRRVKRAARKGRPK